MKQNGKNLYLIRFRIKEHNIKHDYAIHLYADTLEQAEERVIDLWSRESRSHMYWLTVKRMPPEYAGRMYVWFTEEERAV